MNVPSYWIRNGARQAVARLLHPPPFYVKQGGVSAIVIRANGRKENLGRISATYSPRRGTGVK